jgi:uncharacterized protein (TIGR02246 family)
MSTTVGVHGELDRFYQSWNDAFDRRDAAAFVALYAADARLMPPGSPALVGRDAIGAYVEATFFAGGVVGSQMHSATLIETGDYLVDIGTYSITFGGGIETTGNYLTMFRAGGENGLEAAYDIFSPSDVPT